MAKQFKKITPEMLEALEKETDKVSSFFEKSTKKIDTLLNGEWWEMGDHTIDEKKVQEQVNTMLDTAADFYKFVNTTFIEPKKSEA